ncbi:MAG: hypothetical protein Q8O51_01770 [bacterium]|nr:hypothetical protein [bacterium]
MFLPNIACFLVLTTTTADSARANSPAPEDTLQPPDTLSAIELADTVAFLEDASGATYECLVEGYTCLRSLLRVTLSKGWRGEFTADELAKRFPEVRKYPWLQPATFELSSTRKAVYVQFMQNDGFLPVIRMYQDREAKALFYEFQTSRGLSLGIANMLTGF